MKSLITWRTECQWSPRTLLIEDPPRQTPASTKRNNSHSKSMLIA